MRQVLISAFRAHSSSNLMSFAASIGLGDAYNCGLLKGDGLAIDVGNFDLGLVTPVGLGSRYTFAATFFL